MFTRWSSIVFGLIALLLVGCNNLALEQSISLEATYPTPQQTAVTIRYTVPPPPQGKVYVLWIVNPAQHDAVNVGQIPGGRDLTARATVQFEATGAVVSIESKSNPAKMSNTWALKVGSVSPETPTPSVGASSGISTPSAANPHAAPSP